MINSFFNRIFIINLDSRKDRWELITKDLKKLNINNYERFPAIKLDLKDIPESYYSNMQSPRKIHDYYKIGISGCKLSHVGVIKIAKERNYYSILILEDDAKIIDNINELFNNNIESEIMSFNWDMIYFGGQYNKNIINRVSNNLIKAKDILTTHAYGIKNTLYNEVINKALNSGMEMDNFYINFIQLHYNCYCTDPHLIYQMNSDSDILQNYSNAEEATK